LYEFKNEGERKQLIITLTNLSEAFRKAGFRSISKAADKKLIELEMWVPLQTKEIIWEVDNAEKKPWSQLYPIK
jgi:hypothetical protein